MKIETENVAGEDAYTALSTEEVKTLARDYLANAVFFSWQIDEREANLLPSIFMPLMFLDDVTRKMMVRDNIRHFYAYYDKAAPRSINGYPMFFEMRMLNGEDAQRIHSLALKIKQAMDDINE